jgi:hypothetical protein
MSLHRIGLFVIAALFTAATASAASAGCCDRGLFGCGGCGTPTAAVVYAQPVAPPAVVYAQPVAPPQVVYAQPVAPAPVVVRSSTGCGCGQRVVYAAPVVEPTPIAPAPIYVANQGPEYDGPGIVVPYRTWRPTPAIRPYPHFGRFGYRYPVHRMHVAYHGHFHGYTHYHRTMPVARRYYHLH